MVNVSNDSTDKIIKKINQDGFKSGKQVFNIGDVPSYNQLLYKYIRVDYVRNWFLNDMIRFDEPTRWKDKFESRFYTAIYQNRQPQDYPALYALSLSMNKDSEASWLVYSKGEIEKCVRLVFSLSKLRKAFERIINPSGKFYIGEVNYGLNNSEIINLHNKTRSIQIPGGTKNVTNNLYQEVFANNFSLENYLSLLLIKRQIFSYENEIRCFFVPDAGKMTKNASPGQFKEFNNISLKNALVRIDVQEAMSQSDKDTILNWAVQNSVELSITNLYGSSGVITIS